MAESIIPKRGRPRKGQNSLTQKERVAAGLCKWCGESRHPKGTKFLCRACANKNILFAAKKRMRRVASGLCDDCGRPKGDRATMYRCRPCADKSSRKATSAQRKNLYKMSQIQYDALMEKQNGKCAICRNEDTRSLAVDHCHRTGRVRGLLCGKCNTGLGFFRDDIKQLAMAISYLKQSAP